MFYFPEPTNCSAANTSCVHGFCLISGNNYTICKCNEGFHGDACELNINDCAEDSCENGGICHDVISGFECECPPAYSGMSKQLHILAILGVAIFYDFALFLSFFQALTVNDTLAPVPAFRAITMARAWITEQRFLAFARKDTTGLLVKRKSILVCLTGVSTDRAGHIIKIYFAIAKQDMGVSRIYCNYR